MKLKVITLNIWQGKYIDKVVDWLKSEDADVVMLQEVVEKGRGEIEGVSLGGYSRLREELRMEGVYGVMAGVKNEAGEYEYGVAVLSRLDAEVIGPEFYWNKKAEIMSLTEINKAYPGLVTGLRVKMGKRRVAVYSTHFVWSKYPETTQAQIEAAKRLREYLASEKELIMGGDMNMTSDSRAFEIMSHNLINDQPERLESTLHPTIHKVGEKKLAIDYLLHRGEKIRLDKSRVEMVPVSDHLPVVGEYWID